MRERLPDPPAEGIPPGPPAREGPLRPLPWFAGALGAGTLAGLLLPDVELAAGLAFFLLLPLLARRWRLSSVLPRWSSWVCLAAAWRASSVEVAPVDHELSRSCLAAARERPITGRWRPSPDGRTGWVEPVRGGSQTPGHQLFFEIVGPAPRPLEWVSILPGGEVSPWPAGPERAARSRSESFAALSVVRPDELVRLGPGPRALLDPLRDLLGGLRFALGERVERIERGASTGLLRSLLTGDRSGLAPARVDLFARTGTSHLLAISGWHVGVFALLVLLPVTRVLGRRCGLVAGEQSFLLWLVRMLLLGLFTAVAGGGEPVMRAALALALALVGRTWRAPGSTPALGRRADGLSLLAVAFSYECLSAPAGLLSLSLGLTYAATLGLVLGTGPLLALGRGAPRDPQDLQYPRYPQYPWERFAVSPPARLSRALARRARATLASGLAASLAAVLATLPFSWSVFGELALPGPLLTCAALPPFTLLCLLSWAGALLPLELLAASAERCTELLYLVLELGDGLPGTPAPLPPRPLALLWCATLLAFVALRWRRARPLACLVSGALLLPWTVAPAGFELTLLDVGHGTSAVVRAPGLAALVFDAGSRDRRGLYPEALAPLLARAEVARPLVALSHPDLDHSSALGRLSERYPPWGFLGARPAQPPVRLPHGTPSSDLVLGRMELECPCPELRIALLRGSAPRRGEGNAGSRSLELTWRGRRLLLCGDDEGPAALDLAGAPVRLLLFPHHGSDTPFLAPWLEALEPEEVWISASEPPAIAGELERRGIPWSWTGETGTLALRLP